MKDKKKKMRISSILIFSVGLLLGIALFGGTVWADLEAFFYFGSFKTADEGFRTLSCPAIINANETGVVTAKFTNQHNKAIEPVIRVEISDPGVSNARKVEMKPYIDPGSTEQVQWTVTADDMIFGNVVVVKAFQFETYKTPSREGTCGTLVVDLPFMTGGQIFLTGAVTSIILLATGIILWMRSERPMRPNTAHVFYSMVWMGGLTLAGILVGYLGWWALGLGIFLLSVLLIAKTLLYATTANWKTELIPSTI